MRNRPAGGIIPLDGLVLEGEITVNQASLTGESIPVPKHPGGAVYAGTVVEKGEMCTGGEASLRSEPIRPDCSDDRAVGADEVGD